jgi:4-amino-4-deoxy-L-arabinose transferase-like glycosyltransferase
MAESYRRGYDPDDLMSTTTHGTRSVRPGGGLARFLDYGCASHGRAAALLIALALLAFLPGFFQISPVDRDEARFAQATKQMIESGDLVDIRFQNEVRYKKPVGIYWLQSAAVKAGEVLGVPRAHTRIWLYRIPSLLGAVGAVLLTYWTALAFVSRRGAILAAAMMAASILLGVEARLAKTDAVLLLTSVAAMGAMARLYLAERRTPGAPRGWTLPAIFWTAIAAGILIKGPLVLMFVGLAAITLSILDRSVRWIGALRPVPGLIWMIVLVLPWFIAITNRAGVNFFADSLGHDMLEKVASGQEAHGAPPGLYLLLVWVTFWPGAVLLALATPAVWRARREAGTQFLLSWLVPSWIVFEAAMTKLPHYVLPLYPALAILVAGVIERSGLSRARWLVFGTIGWFLFPAVVAVGAIVVSVVMSGDLAIIAWPFGAAAVVTGLFAWRLYDVDGAERSLLRGIVTSVLISWMVFGVILPSIPALFPSAQLHRLLSTTGCDRPAVAAANYHEPSLVFLLGTDAQLTDGAGAAEFLRGGPCRFALLDGRASERSFVQRAEATGLRYSPVGKVEGINISTGRAVSISVYRSGLAP